MTRKASSRRLPIPNTKPGRRPLDPPTDPTKIRTTDQALDYLKTAAMEAAIREACGGISRPAVLNWRRVPAEHCPAIEKVTGIPRVVLRPDLYS
jgi:Bacterial toxin YdaS